MNSLPLQAFQQRIAKSEFAKEWINDPLMSQDIWPVEELGYTKEDVKIVSRQNLYFKNFILSWLKLLTKLTVQASLRKKYALGTIIKQICELKKLDDFLVFKGYIKPELITDNLLQEFVGQSRQHNRSSVLNYATKLWKDEQWLNLSFTVPKRKTKTPIIDVIPEEVLFQIYENFDLFPPPIERLFRLQLVLGCRIGEMLKMPRQCLKQESNNWFLLRWVEKKKNWQFSRIHTSVAELVREQQKFLDTQLGDKSDFNKLFCKVSVSPKDGAGKGQRFDLNPVYLPELISRGTILNWLRDFSKKATLKDKHGNLFNLQSHQFRRTKASLMAYCEAEDEYIAIVLGHSSLDMLPHYRKRSLERLEKEVKTKGYVNKYGEITTFKPRKTRYENLADLLKVSIDLGECHRPIMLGDCQYRYACLNCRYHRVKLEDREKIERDIQALKQDFQEAQRAKQERRLIEIHRLLELLKLRLQGLEKLEKLTNLKRHE